MRLSTDPLTGEKFVPKRNNQRFANDKNRIRYNNNIALERKKYKTNILKQLDLNWSILHDLMNKKNTSSCSEEFLRGAGMHFGYLTHHVIRDKKRWCCVFNYAYLRLNNNEIKIVRL